MNKTKPNNNDLIGDEWETSSDNYELSNTDESAIEESFYDMSLVSERHTANKRTIESVLDVALDRKLLEDNMLEPEFDSDDLGRSSTYTLFIKSEVFNMNNMNAFFFIFISISILIAAIYYIVEYDLGKGIGLLIVVPTAILLRESYKKLKYSIHAFDINPFYIEIGKHLINEKGNTQVFFNTILGISFSVDDFENINTSSKIDATIQFIKNNKEEQATFPYSKLHLCYHDNGVIKILSLDLDIVKVDKLQFVKLVSALLRSNEVQRAHIMSVMSATVSNLNTDIGEHTQKEQASQAAHNDIIEIPTVEQDKTVDITTEEDTVVEEREEPSPGDSFENQNYEVCYNRPSSLMFSGKKDVIKINLKRIFLDYGICNEEDDITIAFDDIIGIAYDEYEAKEGIAAKTREADRDDEEISIYHKQGDRFVNTKVYIYKTETKGGELFDFILLLYKHNVEQRKKIIQMNKIEQSDD